MDITVKIDFYCILQSFHHPLSKIFKKKWIFWPIEEQIFLHYLFTTTASIRLAQWASLSLIHAVTVPYMNYICSDKAGQAVFTTKKSFAQKVNPDRGFTLRTPLHTDVSNSCSYDRPSERSRSPSSSRQWMRF